MAGAVVAAMVLTILLPGTLRLGPQWVLPLIEGLLLVAVIAGDPGRINRRSRWLRELDGGGAAARAHHLPAHADFAFPQQLNSLIAAPDWRPRFIDYLYLGFTNAAFSPTDVMPLAPWAKIAMAVQSLVSLGILGLVIARAVNVFTWVFAKGMSSRPRRRAGTRAIRAEHQC